MIEKQFKNSLTRSSPEPPAHNRIIKKYVTADTNWQKVHLLRYGHYLENKFRVEFFKELRREGILSHYYFNKCISFVQQNQGFRITYMPFARDTFYDALWTELKDTEELSACSVIEEGYEKVEKWRSSEVPITDFKLLREAVIYNGDVSILKHLYNSEKYKTLLYQTTKDGCSLLHVAAQSRRMEVVKYLLTIGLSVNCKNMRGKTPLHYVSGSGGAVIFLTRLLLANGANPGIRDNWGQTVAFQMCRELYPEEYHNWVMFMIGEGHEAIFSQKDSFGNTSLHEVVRCREVSVETLHLYARLNFNFNIANSSGSTVIMAAAKGGQSRTVLECIVKLGGDMTRTDKSGKNVLHYSASTGNLEAIKYFVSMGHNPYLRDTFSFTPLRYFHSSKMNCIETLKLLL